MDRKMGWTRPSVLLGLALLTATAVATAIFSDRAAAADPTPTTLPMHRATDLDGHTRVIGQANSPVTLVFIGTECPISNRYLPALTELAKSPASARMPLMLVISDATITRQAAVEYSKTYSIELPILFDGSGELAGWLKPAVTPEAFVLDDGGRVAYRGRIDDSWASIGKPNAHPTHHELADAIAAVAAGQSPPLAAVPAVGCEFAGRGSATLQKYTYTRNVATILNDNCITCHRTGQAAPFALTSYAEAAKHVKEIVGLTETRQMPPWKPEANFGHFVGERRLTDGQIEILKNWAEQGAAEGDPADLPTPPRISDDWRLGTPDRVVKMPKAFEVPAGGRDVYRAFVVPLDIADTEYVAGIEFRPGNPKVVHHCILFLDSSGAARKKEAANTDGQPGFHSFGAPGFVPTGILGGWAPGSTPWLLPEGIARLARKNSDLVIQMHYHPDGKTEEDQSELAIYFAKRPIKTILASLPLVQRQIAIPPGQADYTREVSFLTPIDVNVLGIIPHMHLLGKEMKVTATTPEGTVIPLIWIKDWDFRWQDQYRYADPVRLPKGTRIDLHAVYDNSSDNPANPSSPPKWVYFGSQTSDEMCVCFLSVTTDSPADLAALHESIVLNLLHGGR